MDAIADLAMECFETAAAVLKSHPNDAEQRVAAEWRQLGDSLVRWMAQGATRQRISGPRL